MSCQTVFLFTGGAEIRSNLVQKSSALSDARVDDPKDLADAVEIEDSDVFDDAEDLVDESDEQEKCSRGVAMTLTSLARYLQSVFTPYQSDTKIHIAVLGISS